MSQKFENIFKEALQNQEAPYSPQAWDALSTRLDKAMPVAGKKPFGPKAAVIVALGIIGATSAWYFTSSSTEPTVREVKTANVEATSKEDNNNTALVSKDEKTTSTDNTSDKSDYKLELTANNDRGIADITTAIPFPTIKSNNGDNTGSIGNSAPGNPLNNPNELLIPVLDFGEEIDFSQGSAERTVDFNSELPKIDNICQFSSEKINNNSDVRMYVEFPSGKQTIVEPKKSSTIKFEEPGGYRIYNAEGRESSFFVYDNTSIEFEIDNINSYQNGLPSKEVELTSIVENAEWTCTKGNQYYTGTKANFIFFNKGIYTVNVKTTNAQGCTTTTSKVVSVNEDYNLLATSAFKPNDLDPKNNRYMPQSLKDRATDFTLVILDPKDGGVVYKTTDAMSGWDGVDRRNGNPAINGSTYIWKVTVNNTYPGEKNDYKGTLTVILDR